MVGKTISHYRITEKLGQGGMGIIYKAEDTILKRTVALKFLPPELTLDPQAKERFIREAQAASALDHPNICIIHEIAETEDRQIFICMTFYRGESLMQLIKKGPVPLDQAIQIIIQIARGLKATHDEKIIHRDIKPANILITDKGEVKIVDFGLAKLAGEKLTESYSTKGTIAYMAPELIRGQPGDQRSDIWSLGVVFYEMLTGHLPFTGAFPEPMMYAIVNKKPEVLSRYMRNNPESIQKIVDKLLRKKPQERYQTIDALLTDLAPVSGNAVSHAVYPFYHHFARMLWKKKSRFFLAATALVLLTLIFFSVIKPLQRNLFYPEKPYLALISFQNQTGDKRYDVWEKGIPNLLISKLSQTAGLQVTSWERLQDLKNELGKQNFDFIDLDLGIQLCKREGAELVITGTLFKAGNVFTTDLKIFDVGSKNIIATAGAQGEGEASILKYQIDNLGREIIRGLGFSERMLASLQKPVSTFTTSSSEAYKFYIMGNEKKAKWRFAEARPFYETAIQYDSTFGLAYYQLGKWIYGPLGFQKKSEEALAKAIQYLGQSTDYESLRWRWDYYLHRDIDKADSLINVMIEIYGQDASTYYRQGCVYKIKKEYDKAIEAFNQVITIDPEHLYAIMQLGYCNLNKKNYEQAEKYFKKSIALRPDNANTYDSLADTYREMGNIDGMIYALEQGYAADPNFPWAAEELAKCYAFQEDYNKTMKWVGHLYKPFKEQPHTMFYVRGLYHFLQGKRKQALSDLDKAIRVADSLSETDKTEISFQVIGEIVKSWIYYEMGHYDKGYEVLKSPSAKNLEAEFQLYRHKFKAMANLQIGNLDSAKYHHQAFIKVMQDSTGLTKYQLSLFRFLASLINIEVLLAEDKYESALALSRQLKYNEWDIFILERKEYILLPLQLDLAARALLKSGKLDEAIGEYERLTSSDPLLRGWQFIPAKYHYILGTLYEQKHWPGKAIDRYKHFLKVWENADTDIPELDDARRRLQALRSL